LIAPARASGAFVDSGAYTELNDTCVVATKMLTSADHGSTVMLEARATVVWPSDTTATFKGGKWRC
jgi:hypothetical protein